MRAVTRIVWKGPGAKRLEEYFGHYKARNEEEVGTKGSGMLKKNHKEELT